MDEKIDFVLTWVDGQDPAWNAEKSKYASKTVNEANSAIRYRDWDLLKYWFRSVEENAGWVNKIYFVTCGQKPDWLDETNPKLVLVNHEDFIPKEFLPTFNSNVIELYIHKIPDLSEKFVYFNDDMFIVSQMNQSDFFAEEKVKDALIFNAVSVHQENSMIEHIILNNLELLARDFTKKDVERNNKGKIYTFSNGKKALKSFLLKPWKYFTGIENSHVALPYLKSTWETVWQKYGEELNQTAQHKFRSKEDYNHWIMRYYQLFSGQFEPTSLKQHRYCDLENDNKDLINDVLNHKFKMICLNDSSPSLDYEKVKAQISGMFESLYPHKSSFEK